MEIEQIKAARSEMEDSIQAAACEAVKVFYEKTGMFPHSIEIQLLDVTTTGDREKRFAVGNIRADVPL